MTEPIIQPCDGCGLIKRVYWQGPDDIPADADADPGGYCPDCLDDLGILG